jgi:translocation and assembly module TamA
VARIPDALLRGALAVILAGPPICALAQRVDRPPDALDDAGDAIATDESLSGPQSTDAGTAASRPSVSIEINGLPDRIKTAVLPNLSIQQATAADFTGGENDIRYLHKQSRKQLTRALRSFGYYRATVGARLLRDDGRWVASYQVEPGAQVQYGEVTVALTGAAEQEPLLLQRIREFPIRVGDVLDHEQYEQAKSALLREVHERGYLNAELMRHRVTVNLESYEARLALTIESGPLFRFGQVTLVQDVLDPAFLQRHVNVEPGERYSVRKLLELESALRNTDFFSSVEVKPEVEQADAGGRVPVRVLLEPNKRDRFMFGLGFGTNTGPRGQVGWKRRWMNQHGHTFASNLLLSLVDSAFDNRYAIPLADPQHDELIFSAGYRNNNPDSYDSKIGYAGISRSVLRGRTRVNYFLRYQHEDYTVADEAGVVNMLIPGVTLTRVQTDDRLNTRKGNSVDVTLQGGPDIAFFDVRFLQLRAFAKLIFPLGGRARFITRGEFGTTLAPDLDELPASLRFFTGGDQSVRGYPYESLGPRNDQGEVTGGRHLAVGSVELDYEVVDKWRVAAFADAGNAFDDVNEPLERGAGIGIRYQTPVGPIRVDIANAISDPDRSWRLHVTFGPDL